MTFELVDEPVRDHDQEMAALDGCLRALAPIGQDGHALKRIYEYLQRRYPEVPA